MLYWHVLLGDDRQLRIAAQAAQSRITGFSGLHMTPLEWLHLTVLVAGPADQTPEPARSEMLSIARSSLAGIETISVEFSRVFYHPEAIGILARPAEALMPLREAAQRATRAVTGYDGDDDRSAPLWTPHVTLCYSTSEQPAGPIITALGKDLPGCRVAVDALSLVVQRGAEWLWDWSPVGAVTLLGDLLSQNCRNGLGACTEVQIGAAIANVIDREVELAASVLQPVLIQPPEVPVATATRRLGGEVASILTSTMADAQADISISSVSLIELSRDTHLCQWSPRQNSLFLDSNQNCSEKSRGLGRLRSRARPAADPDLLKFAGLGAACRETLKGAAC
jgi:2'-5' RNA ligase